MPGPRQALTSLNPRIRAGGLNGPTDPRRAPVQRSRGFGLSLGLLANVDLSESGLPRGAERGGLGNGEDPAEVGGGVLTGDNRARVAEVGGGGLGRREVGAGVVGAH